jgi:hypothetical protein
MSEYSNPPVHSKFDRSHGKGVPVKHVSMVEGAQPVSGTKKAGFTENGAMLPRKSTLTLGKGEHRG